MTATSEPWSALPSVAHESAAGVVSSLLHDWIKPMELWLLSVDWSDPPEDAPALLERSVRRTRKTAEGARGARSMWLAARDALLELGGDVVEAWCDGLDGELAALEALLDLDVSALRALGAAEMDGRIRAPGRRLRQARSSLSDV